MGSIKMRFPGDEGRGQAISRKGLPAMRAGSPIGKQI